MMVRHWRPLVVITIWLIGILLSVLFAPQPQAPVWSAGSIENGLLGTLGLAANPTLLVFHRPGGITPADRSYVDEIATATSPTAEGPQPYGDTSGETLVLTVAAQAADIPALRARLQGAPSGLETHVTGAAAFSWDAITAWERSRPFVLLGLVVVAALVALLGRLGPGRTVVVAASAGAAGTVTSALAALLAPPAPVALATVLSAGLAGAWAVRLLLAMPIEARTPFVPRPPAENWTESEPAPAPTREVSPLQRVLIVTGEVTLLQAFIVIVGLTGFLFDSRAGGALLLGLIVAVVASLSAAPALTTLLAQPRSTEPKSRVLRTWVRVVLTLVLIAGLYWLVPTARPADMVTRRSDAATGYDLLRTAGASGAAAVAPSHLLPTYLLIQAPASAFDVAGVAALQELIANLGKRPAVATVEGPAAVQQPAPPEISATLAITLAQAREQMASVESALATQAGALSQVITDIRSLGVSLDVSPIETTLGEAGTRLANVKENLASANEEFARIPIEFPEVASRIDHVPTLRTMPATLATAVSDLEGVAVQLRAAVTQTRELAASRPGTGGENPLAQVQTQLAGSVAALKSLAVDAAALRGELERIDTALARARVELPAASDAYLACHNVARLTLIPAGDPYSQATLDDVQPLRTAVEDWLQKSPLAGSLVTWGGAPVTAAALRAQALQDLLLRGVIVTTVALALVTWSTLSRLGPTLLVTAGALLSAAAGIGVATAVLQGIDAGVLALVAVALIALAGGRLIVGRAPVVEDLPLALAPLTLLLSGVPTLMAVGLAGSAGLLANCFLILPTLIRRPRRTPPGD
jgi:hypothetical protein